MDVQVRKFNLLLYMPFPNGEDSQVINEHFFTIPYYSGERIEKKNAEIIAFCLFSNST